MTLDVREVVEEKATHGDRPELLFPGRAREIRELSISRKERKWNKRLEAAGFVLKGAKLLHVVDLLSWRLKVPEKKRRVRPESLAVRLTVHIEPHVA